MEVVRRTLSERRASRIKLRPPDWSVLYGFLFLLVLGSKSFSNFKQFVNVKSLEGVDYQSLSESLYCAGFPESLNSLYSASTVMCSEDDNFGLWSILLNVFGGFIVSLLLNSVFHRFFAFARHFVMLHSFFFSSFFCF